ncbi:Putative teichuronic acid biosynthesis glycosyltransferase TuaC [Microbacterium oleivorans]|uniref:glycosyltransferase n=1 Tax=Microbacterium oleivorans TaxID=273677 RepID=UPI0009F92DF6|nr:glycosyltransferase [Microbacterium oleivorans]AZS44856.1 Putative teichuronic acid biosynthesis glycosyltransferase TuaC [Microbacterium oleivorans]
MTILHVVEAFGGGVQSALSHFIATTPELNHVVVAREREGERAAEFQAIPIVTHEGNIVSFARRVRREVRARRPAAIHFHSSKAGAIRPLIQSGPERVYSPHCFAFERTDIGGLRRTFFKAAEAALSYWTEAVVAVSPHEANLASALRRRLAVYQISNLPPLDAFVLQPGDQRRVVTIGRIAPQKDPAFFAEIARRSDDSIQFVWVGDGDPIARAELEKSGVEVTGWQNQAGVEAELKRSSLYLHAAAWEASPMSIAQALAFGKPILCRDLATLSSLGYLTVGSYPESAAVAVQRYFFDDDFAASVISASEQAVKTQSEVDSASELLAAYKVPRAGLPNYQLGGQLGLG